MGADRLADRPATISMTWRWPMHVTSITERWADFFTRTPYDALPPDVVQHARRALLDYLGVALAGRAMPMARIVADYYLDLGGREQASLLLDMDDGHRAAAGHPGVATLPAALAGAEPHGATGRELLSAIVFGYEVFV